LFSRVLGFGGCPVELVGVGYRPLSHGTHVTEQLPYINRARRRTIGEFRHQSRVRRGETVSGRKQRERVSVARMSTWPVLLACAVLGLSLLFLGEFTDHLY
jgi:hypothetical protein